MYKTSSKHVKIATKTDKTSPKHVWHGMCISLGRSQIGGRKGDAEVLDTNQREGSGVHLD